MGVTDGVSSVANGILNQVNLNQIYVHIRPPRALEPADADACQLAIVPLNLAAAFAQEFVLKRSRHSNYEDAFISYISLEVDGEAIILSTLYIYWRRAKTLWGRVWTNVSHCLLLGKSVGIMLYSGESNSSPELVVIPCRSTACAMHLYSYLAANSHRMGNPISVIPADIVEYTLMDKKELSSSSSSSPPPKEFHDEEDVSEEFIQQLEQVWDGVGGSKGLSLLGELDGYRFGSANFTKLKPITGSEEDVLKRAQYFIGQGFVSNLRCS